MFLEKKTFKRKTNDFSGKKRFFLKKQAIFQENNHFFKNRLLKKKKKAFSAFSAFKNSFLNSLGVKTNK